MTLNEYIEHQKPLEDMSSREIIDEYVRLKQMIVTYCDRIEKGYTKTKKKEMLDSILGLRDFIEILPKSETEEE